MVSISVLGSEVFGVDFGLVVKVADDGDHIGRIQHFNVVFVGGDDDPDVSFGSFDEVVLLESQQVLTGNRFS